ncbi:putative mitochondrial escape protein 2 protein [Phaeoacremonium minimum UCRPA7]|uniref:Mitochondrial escape protein 2 n=1 Tax=Phaeoacremonium minimum (strain UCR-PA7) TaxID=1286976 RepID=R8BW43_PHAM7|nr:putative mitochondrial escape protein 2 protein [Phaeoacremonium minimum UCRPA7]EOO03562.1 putative mitochondrial escape protein 2 protein [Phaeoacremonium minimum UCRPA7]
MIPRRIAFSRIARPGLAAQVIHRPQARLPPPRWATKAWESTTTGDQKSGHIYAGPNESIIFFDNLFPLKLSTLIWRPWQTDRDLSTLLKKFDESSLGIMDPINMVKRAIPSSLPIKVTDIIPRLKDGGAFVRFTYSPETSPAEVEEALRKILDEKPIRPWFNPFRGIKAGLVQGVPWLEDLYRFPKSRLRVEFVPKEPGSEAVELPQETLYSLFRRYGKIAEITPQPPDSKVLPKFAYVDFVLVRDAIMARNTMHNFVVPENEGGGKLGTKIRMSYEQKVKAHHIWSWVTNHPRIVIPVVAALIAGLTVIIFDPIREFFIKAHIQHKFRLTNSKLYKWFKRQTNDILSFRRQKGEEAGLKALFTHRRDAIDSIRTWLLETADTFIVVQGPRGSGKEELVIDQALGNRKDVLVIDCKPITEARGESGTIKHLAAEVGYRPIFSWANQMSSLIDLAVQSTTGVKSGFSETLDSQLSKILQTTAAALKSVTLEGRDKNDKDFSASEDAFLEAHPEKRAVVVIQNFLHKSDENNLVYDKIADWAAALVQANIAHVIFLTNDTSYSKSLSKSLPDRVFRQIALGDLSPDVAKKYVLSHLEETDLEKVKAPQHEESEGGDTEEKREQQERTEKEHRRDMTELDEVIEALGGRLTDLEFLARRLKSGQSPKEAVTEIIDQSASEIIKMFLLAGSGSSKDKKYSTEQVWFLIKEIASKESLRYNEVLLSDTFASSTTSGAENGEAALESLVNAELIIVTSHKGRPQTIRAGKPVYQSAFNTLLRDPVLKARMDMAVLKELAKVEAKTIDKCEQELSLLGSLPKQPAQTGERVNYLLTKLQDSQTKIAGYEKDIGALKKVLKHEA